MSLKAETEMAMKLLEKDIHEKQDTIISLRRQLEDIKQINLEMYRKLQVNIGFSSQICLSNDKIFWSIYYKLRVFTCVTPVLLLTILFRKRSVKLN